MRPYHDLGGRRAGPVKTNKQKDPIFECSWHKRVLGLTVASGAMGAWSIDTSRFRRETLPKEDYQSYTYYEKWLAALNNLFVSGGFVDLEEIKNGVYDADCRQLNSKTLRANEVPDMLATGAKASRPSSSTPAFCLGEKVKTKRPSDTLLQNPGHTRLPHYAAGKTGVILFYHGHHVLPNSNAHFLGESPEPLYSVEFSSEDLWSSAEPGDSVIVDCWESYLEPKL